MKQEVLEHTNVPYIVHEGDMARLERSNKRLWVLCIVIFLALILSNLCWLYYESQFEYIETTQEVVQECDGGNNTFIGGDSNG